MRNRDSRSTRRDFLGGLFKKMAEPAGKALKSLNDDNPLKPAREAPPPTTTLVPIKVLRPPGALPEEQFVLTCCQNGQCLDVCPVQAIRVWYGDGSGTHWTPYIEPEIQACVLCDTLACMDACPSGAIRRVPRDEIRMGVARPNWSLCARYRGQECQVCVDSCPVGEFAIRVDPFNKIEVSEQACTGCGVCQQVCPERPRAISVTPR